VDLKTLSPEQMIELLPLTASQLQVGEMLFALAIPEIGNVAEIFHRQVDEGTLQTIGIAADGEHQFAVWYHVDGEVLHVNGVQRLRSVCKIEALVGGLDMLAKREGCKMLRGVARRPGLIRVLQRADWQAFGVMITKKI
jgi:hypothetical protein